MIHNEQIIIKLDTNNVVKSATVFPLEYLTEDKSVARNLPPVDLSESELSELIEQFSAATTAQLAEANAAIETLTKERDEALAKLSAIESTIWDKRKIDPSAWYARLTMDNVLAITEAATKDPIANSFVVALKESRQLRRDDPTYQMSLDHPNVQAGIAYLSGQPIPIDANGNTATIAMPVFTNDEAISMLADSKADEQ